MSFDLAGNPIEETSIVPRQRARRAKPLNPLDPKTWHEVTDLQPRLKERLRLGAWVAWHVRKQGDHAEWGNERLGARRQGIIEAVPAAAAWGVLDWTCVPTDPREHGVLWIELKSEAGKLSEPQAEAAIRLARAGQEVAVLRPRHFFGNLGEGDMVFVRLVEHRRTPEWSTVLVQPDMLLPQVLKL